MAPLMLKPSKTACKSANFCNQHHHSHERVPPLGVANVCGVIPWVLGSHKTNLIYPLLPISSVIQQDHNNLITDKSVAAPLYPSKMHV
eukprot:1585399-Amphidinium_carterae.1